MLERDGSHLFGEEHRAFRDSVRRFIAREFTPRVAEFEDAGLVALFEDCADGVRERTLKARLELRCREAFEQAGRLERLEAFASERGADFYGVPRNPGQITLRKKAWTVPEHYAFGGDQVVPLRAGSQVAWQLVSA